MSLCEAPKKYRKEGSVGGGVVENRWHAALWSPAGWVGAGKRIVG